MAESGGDGTNKTVKTRPLPSTRSKYMQPELSGYGEIATIEVGNEDRKKIFRVHKGFLSFYSGYFRAALEGALAESERRHHQAGN